MNVRVNGGAAAFPHRCPIAQATVCRARRRAPHVRVTVNDTRRDHGFPARPGDRTVGPEARPARPESIPPAGGTTTPGEGRGQPAWRVAGVAAWGFEGPGTGVKIRAM